MLDGVGGAVKRALRTAVPSRKVADIRDARSFAKSANASFPKLEVKQHRQNIDTIAKVYALEKSGQV